MQPRATETGDGKNEPTARDFEFAATAVREKKLTPEGEL
jgi:hypothetical protein